MKIAINLHPLLTKGGADKVMYVIADALSSDNEVDIITVGDIDRSQAERLFAVDLSRVRIRRLRDGGGVIRRVLDDLLAGRREGNRYKKMYTTTVASRMTGQYDVFINGESGDVIRSQASCSLLYVFFPWDHAILNRCRNPVHFLYSLPYLLWRKRFSVGNEDSYTNLVTSSEYVRRHIRDMWGRESVILHPPIDLEAMRPLPKSNTILAAGRVFRGTGHEKRFELLVDVFRSLCDRGLRGWELHIAGFVNDESFAAELKTASSGYPVVFHFDVPHAELAELYGRAKIYWHAAGYGHDLDGHPEKAEHFGMTTVEAMAAGCVPVVYGAGGQPEIVDHGRNGYVWREIRELVALTLAVAGNDTDRSTLSHHARADSSKYCRAAFADNLRRLIEEARTNVPLA